MTAERLTDKGVAGEIADVPATEFSIARRKGLWRDALLRRLLALADALAALAVSASLALSHPDHLAKALWSALFVPVWLLLAKLYGLYDSDHRALRHLTVDELAPILILATSGTALLALFLGVTPAGGLSTGAAVRAWLIAALGAFAFRALARIIWRRLTPRARTLIVGGGALAAATRRKLQLFPDIHVEVVGECERLSKQELNGTLNGPGRLDRVILASQSLDENLIADLVGHCRRGQIKLSVIPPARGIFGTAVQLKHVADLPVVDYNTWDVSRSTMLLKRVLDVTVSLLALTVFAPLFVLVALLIVIDSPGPVFFSQIRAGMQGRPFRMLKFRTMAPDAESRLAQLVHLDSLGEPMFKLRNDPRVTRVGALLRRMSLDELPQLVNVLRGDMSLVGPRPEQIELVERYTPEQSVRLGVKPGLTGPMQVYGRGQLTFGERLSVEREYVENISIGRDLRILTLTVAAVFAGRGAF